MPRILFVANVCKEHLIKFHIPTMKKFKDCGWIVDAISSGDDTIQLCDNYYKAKWKRSPFNVNLFFGIRQLKKILSDNYYDIIYCHTPVGGLVARVASKRTRRKGTKVIYCAHGLHFYKGSPIINWLIFYPIEKWLSKFSDGIFLVNNEDYLLAKRKFYNSDCIKLVPEVGINISRLKIDNCFEVRKKYREEFGFSNSDYIMVYVAEIIKNKNQIMLLKVLNEFIKKEINNVKLLIVGPDHYNKYLQKKAHKMGLTEYIVFTGWRKDVGEILYSSDICVASSIREGFGLNLIEAMYCGLPVVATKNRGHSTIIDDKVNGFLVDINDYKMMFEYVNRIRTNDINFVKPQKEDILKYDAEKVAEYLCNLLINTYNQ